MNSITAKYILSLILFISLGNQLKANSYKHDSLRTEELGKQSLKLVYSKPDSAYQLINAAFNICEKHDDSKLWSLTYNYLGIYYDVTGNQDSAMLSYKKAVKNAKIGNHLTNQAGALNNIGLLYWNDRKYDSAITYYFQALDIYEKLNSLKGIGNVYSNIGLIYNHQKKPDKALEFSRKALKIKKQLNDTLGIGKSLANIGGNLEKLGKYDSTLFYYNLAEPYLEAANNKYSLATLYHDKAGVNKYLKNYDQAILLARKALKMRISLGSKKQIASSLNLLGVLYYYNKEYNKAHPPLDSAIAIYEKYNILKELRGCYERKALIFKAQENLEQSMAFYEKYIKTTKDWYAEERSEKLKEIEEKYENEKTKSQLLEKDKEILEGQKRSNSILFMLIVAVILAFVILVYFLNRSKRNKEQKQKELLEQKVEISRELHDNIGSQLSYLNQIVTKDLKKNENSSLEQIHKINKGAIQDLRTTIWGFNKKLDAEDLKAKLADELKKSKLSYPNIKFKLDAQIINFELDSKTAVNILRITQEALNNACKHSNGKNIKVELKIQDEQINLKVQDDGTGISKSNTTGFGLSNMEQRAQKIGGALKIDSNSEIGTVVNLIVNNTNAL